MPSWTNALTRAPRPSAMPRLRRPSLAMVVSLLVAIALLLGGWVWLRDSSLVAVENVTVRGATGLGAPAVRSSLTGAAQQMTTLNLDRRALNAAHRGDVRASQRGNTRHNAGTRDSPPSTGITAPLTNAPARLER